MKSQPYQDPDVIRGALDGTRIAIIGLSANELRASNFVGRYLKYHGYRVVPVNPMEQQIIGETCYPSLREVPEPVDIVNVFRRPEEVPAIVEDSLEMGARTLWLQFGVINEGAAAAAQAGGMQVVMDRCIKVEHARYLGRMHWLGLNTGRISAVRARAV